MNNTCSLHVDGRRRCGCRNARGTRNQGLARVRWRRRSMPALLARPRIVEVRMLARARRWLHACSCK